MQLEFNETQLLELMKDFYILTGIRIVLFDDEYQELLSYPPRDCGFCAYLKKQAATRSLCAKSDQQSFQKCQEERRLIIYHCHAGLVEATVPLIDNHIVIGYLMFGQISDAVSFEEMERIFSESSLASLLPRQKNILDEIPIKTGEQIHAAAKIMEACTFYAVLSETISLRRQNFTKHLQEYLIPKLHEHLSAESIALDLGISRSKLYSACDKYLGMGIAEYIKILRMEHAQHLLKNSDLTITQIADRVGFADYNYFCRVFRKKNGCSAKKYREHG